MDALEELNEKIEDLKKQAIELAQKNKAPIIQEMRKKISLYGITAIDLGFVEKSGLVGKPVSTPSAVKYKKDDKTWTGRGRKPQFIIDHLASGGSLEDFLVN